jgi:hypothetical protein
MKLLTLNQVKEKKDEQIQRDILRTSDIEKAASQARINLAKAEAEFNATLAKNREIWANEEQEHATRKQEMTSEVEVLEERKKQALEPLSLFQKDLEKQKKELDDLSINVKISEALNEELKERLEDKLDEVGEREQDVLRETQILEGKKESVEIQSEQTVQGIKRLNDSINAFLIQKEDTESRLDQIRLDLDLEKQNVDNNKRSLERKEQTLITWENKLRTRETLLKNAMQLFPYKKGKKTAKIE